MIVDVETESGQKVAHRLRTETMIWLTVARDDKAPFPLPVWFVWEEDRDSIVIYSRADAKRIEHMRKNPKVALNLNGDFLGGEIVVMTGVVSFDDDIQPITENQPYIDKYEYLMKTLIGMTPETMGSGYALGYRVNIDYLRAP